MPVIELETDAGLVGLGETYADEAHLRRLGSAGRTLIGHDVFALNPMYAAVRDALAGERGSDGHGLTGMITTSSTINRVFSPFEVAALDVQGQSIGRPVSDLLGGAVRDRVPFSAYLFYKWAGHPGAEPDAWGEALTAGAIVAQAERMVAEYGFKALKLKGGVMDPDAEIAAVRALHERFPQLPIRLDSNSHLGISLAAMIHLAAATPNLTYACDTHWPWKSEDVVAGDPFAFRGGSLAVPTGPGLGVQLDRDRLGALHEQYLRCGIRDRDDAGYRRSLEPGYVPRTW